MTCNSTHSPANSHDNIIPSTSHHPFSSVFLFSLSSTFYIIILLFTHSFPFPPATSRCLIRNTYSDVPSSCSPTSPKLPSHSKYQTPPPTNHRLPLLRDPQNLAASHTPKLILSTRPKGLSSHLTLQTIQTKSKPSREGPSFFSSSITITTQVPGSLLRPSGPPPLPRPTDTLRSYIHSRLRFRLAFLQVIPPKSYRHPAAVIPSSPRPKK